MSPGCVTEGAGPAARWHCPRIVPCRSGSSSPGRSAEPSPREERGVPGGAFPGQKGQRTRVPSSQPVTSGLGGRGPDRGPGVAGFVPCQPSGGCPGEAEHPLHPLPMAFPPGGWPGPGAPGGGCSSARHLSRESLCSCHSPEEPQSPAPCSWLNCNPLAWSG